MTVVGSGGQDVLEPIGSIVCDTLLLVFVGLASAVCLQRTRVPVRTICAKCLRRNFWRPEISSRGELCPIFQILRRTRP